MGLKVIWGTQLTVKVDELARTYQTLKQLFIVSIWLWCLYPRYDGYPHFIHSWNPVVYGLDIQIYILSSNLFFPNFPFSELSLWSDI